jgi:hypothetical protein
MSRGVAVKGKRYWFTVLMVLERDAQGRPKRVECLYDTDHTKIVGGEHFWIVLAPVEMTRGVKGLH